MFSAIILKLKYDYTLCFEDLNHKRGWNVKGGKNIGEVFWLPSILRKKMVLDWKQDTGHEELQDSSKEPLPPKEQANKKMRSSLLNWALKSFIPQQALDASRSSGKY